MRAKRIPHKKKLTHIGADGDVRMVDISDKSAALRTAIATAVVTMKPGVLADLIGGRLKKGEALVTAKIAAIQAAKRTGDLIPLCHSLPLDWVDVAFDAGKGGKLTITVTARTRAATGVEMEALTAAATAALTIYDMAKAADKAMVMGPIRLERKTGGRCGDFRR